MEIVKIVHRIRVEVVVAQLVMGINAVKTSSLVVHTMVMKYVQILMEHVLNKETNVDQEQCIAILEKVAVQDKFVVVEAYALILGMEILVEAVTVEVEKLQVAALILAQVGQWGSMDVNLLNQVVVIQKVRDGLAQSAHVKLPKWTLEAIVESQLTKIVCALEVLLGTELNAYAQVR